jgi:hypothetical protein
MAAQTPLQSVLRRYFDSFEAATEHLDEHEHEVFLDIATIRLAREQARRIEREGGRAA